MPNFTTEDLLVYLYEEMDLGKANELETAMQHDWALRQKYCVLAEAHHKLDETPLSSPRLSTIAGILHYAEANLHLSN